MFEFAHGSKWKNKCPQIRNELGDRNIICLKNLHHSPKEGELKVML